MIQSYAQFWHFRTSSGNSFPPQFVYDFSRKMFLLYSIKCTYFIVLITFSSWDIGQYVYRNFLFEINLISLIKLFSTRPESQDKI